MMSHTPKIMGLLAMLLLIQGDISLAAKDPPPLSPHQYPPAPTQMQVLRPDLVPWKHGGGIGITNFSCAKQGEVWLLKILFGFKNIGTAKAGPFKVLVKVNGTVWDHPQNPITWAELPPNYDVDWNMDRPVPGPGSYTLWVKVDSDNVQLEKNETNNVTTAITTCR